MKVNITTPWQLCKGTGKHHIIVEFEALPHKGDILHGKKLFDFLKKEAEELKHVSKDELEACVGGCYNPDDLIYVAHVSHNVDTGSIQIELTSHDDGSEM